MPSDLNLNTWLKDTYGASLLDRSKPKYRLVWTTNLTEKRHGTFNDYYGKIFIRSVTATREVLKYPFDQDRWVLEIHLREPNPELIGGDGYEPIWTFKDKDGGFLPINRRAIEIIINTLENPVDNPVAVLEDMEAKKDEQQLAKDIDFIGELMRSPYFGDLVE